MLAAKYELEEDILMALGWTPKINQTDIKVGIEAGYEAINTPRRIHQTSINRAVIRLKKQGIITELGESKTYGERGVSVPLLGLTEGGLFSAIYYVLESPETIKNFLQNYSEQYDYAKDLLTMTDFIIKNTDKKTQDKTIKDFFLWIHRFNKENVDSETAGFMLDALLIADLGIDNYIKLEKETNPEFNIEAYEGLRKWVDFSLKS